MPVSVTLHYYRVCHLCVTSLYQRVVTGRCKDCKVICVCNRTRFRANRSRSFEGGDNKDVSVPAKLDGTRVRVITITNFPAAAPGNTKRRLAEIAVYGLASDRRARLGKFRVPGTLCPLILSFGNLMEF